MLMPLLPKSNPEAGRVRASCTALPKGALSHVSVGLIVGFRPACLRNVRSQTQLGHELFDNAVLVVFRENDGFDFHPVARVVQAASYRPELQFVGVQRLQPRRPDCYFMIRWAFELYVVDTFLFWCDHRPGFDIRSKLRKRVVEGDNEKRPLRQPAEAAHSQRRRLQR